MTDAVHQVVRSPVDDAALSALQRTAAGLEPGPVHAWAVRLERHSLTWVQAYAGERLVGFVNVAWDGGLHAFLLDTAVDPAWQHRGIGTGLVAQATEAARTAGCAWLHVDHEPHLDDFYLRACGFAPTAAGLRRLA